MPKHISNMKGETKFSEDLEILIQRQYKKIKKERILDVTKADIDLLGIDEIFVKLMDYKNAWLSNYGRAIRYSDGKYNLLQGSYDNYGVLRYTLPKNVFFDGKWIYKNVVVYAAKAVVEEFIVNPDKVNNTYIWHSGYDKQDCYYKNLYPLKEYKEDFIKDIAEQYKDEIPYKVYEAMMNWVIEITD